MSDSPKNQAKHTVESAYVTKSWNINESDSPYEYSDSALMVARRTPAFLKTMEKIKSTNKEIYDEINSHLRIANVPEIKSNALFDGPKFHVYSLGDHYCYVTTTLPHDLSQSFPVYTSQLCLSQLESLKEHVNGCIKKKSAENPTSVWVIRNDFLNHQFFPDTDEGYRLATIKFKEIVDHVMNNFSISDDKGFDSSRIPELKRTKVRLSDHEDIFKECNVKRLFF